MKKSSEQNQRLLRRKKLEQTIIKFVFLQIWKYYILSSKTFLRHGINNIFWGEKKSEKERVKGAWRGVI